MHCPVAIRRGCSCAGNHPCGTERKSVRALDDAENEHTCSLNLFLQKRCLCVKWKRKLLILKVKMTCIRMGNFLIFVQVTKESWRDLEYVILKWEPLAICKEKNLSRPPWRDKFPIKNPFQVLKKCSWLESRAFNQKFYAHSMSCMARMTN